MINFECPRCKESLLVASELSGTQLACSNCQAMLKVPSAETNSIEVKAQRLSPAEIDEMQEAIAVDDIFGVSCIICDSRVLVRTKQLDTKVKCPVCFAEILVKRPAESSAKRKHWQQSGNVKSQINPDLNVNETELDAAGKRSARQSPADELPLEDIDESFGLAPVSENLLAPVNPPPQRFARLEDIPELEIVSDSELTGSLDSPDDGLQANIEEPASRRQRYDAAQEKAQAGKSKKSGPSLEEMKKQFDGFKIKVSETDRADHRFPEFSFSSLTRSVLEMLGSPGLAWRAGLAAVLLVVGRVILHYFANSYRAIADPTAGDFFLNTMTWFMLGGLPWLAGTLLLWFVCGYVFRESALGQKQVTVWGARSVTDFSSTFLLFGFSYFLAGLPFFFLPVLMAPVRMLFAPIFLLAVWYNKSPFLIVAVDAFQTLSQDKSQWKSFYLYVAALAGLALVAGLFLMVSYFLWSLVGSLIGVAILVPVTIAFAAVTGWHCGRIVDGLDDE